MPTPQSKNDNADVIEGRRENKMSFDGRLEKSNYFPVNLTEPRAGTIPLPAHIALLEINFLPKYQ